MMQSRTIFFGLIAGLVFAAACGTARRGEPLRGPLAFTDSEVNQGHIVFNQFCNRCHPGGEAGLGPALNDKPLPGFMIKMQVRKGMGDMPAFKEHKISDEQLDQLVKYMKALRKK